MSSVKIQGSATGTANFTIAVPDGTSTDRTINLPDAAGSFVLDDGSGNVDITGTVTAERLTADASGEAILSLNGYTASQNTEVQLVAVRDDVSTSKSLLDIKTNDGTSLVRRMRITSDGNVGIGETAPLGLLHIKSEDTGAGSTPASTGNLLVLEGTENGMTIFSAGSGAGYINFGDSSNNTSGMIVYDHSANAMKFWANAAQRMMLDQNGDLQYGKTDGSQNTQGIILNSYGTIRANSQADVALHLIRSTAGNIVRFYHNNTTLVGNINVTSTGTSYNTTSDYRLKENVTELTGAIDRVKQVPVHRFNFIADPDKTVDGFLAHEVADVVPEAITGEKDGMRTEEYEVTPAVLDDDGNVVTEAVMGTHEVPDYQGIDQSKLVPLLTAAIKEQQALIEDLQTRLAALEAV